MKTIKLLAIIFFLALQSCNSIYYQVYEATPKSNLSKDDNTLVFEDNNCIISYNLWSEAGNPGFTIYNKTSKTLYLDKYSSYFIINGIAKDYYLDRVYTTGESVVLNSLFYNLSGTADVSTSYNEKAIVAVPSQTQKMISEYNINKNYLKECDLKKYPTRNKVRTKKFNASDSPLSFENRLSYFFEKDDQVYEITNAFYISGVTNYPSSEIIDNVSPENCGETSFGTVPVNTAQAPDKFYITYSKNKL